MEIDMKAHIVGEPLKKDKLKGEAKKELQKLVNNYLDEKVGKWLYSDMEEIIDIPYKATP